ncbi:MAG: hypothetical protein IKY10_05255 [Clostridia bacterium]|nr:hypothetical protein [Clostridia bacterium]
MWTKSKDIIEYANEYLGDVTVDEIKNFAKNLKLEITKEEISAWLFKTAKENGVDMFSHSKILTTQKLSDLDDAMLLEVAKEIAKSEERKKYTFNEKDYDMYVRNLRIYKQKCMSLCTILLILSTPEIESQVQKQLDITTKGHMVLTADLDRLLKPLKVNYQKAKELKLYAENFASYLRDFSTPITGRIRTSVPTSSLINHSKKPNDECVEMTEKLRAEYKEKHDKILRNAMGLDDQY